jgi:hypothetical protein
MKDDLRNELSQKACLRNHIIMLSKSKEENIQLENQFRQRKTSFFFNGLDVLVLFCCYTVKVFSSSRHMISLVYRHMLSSSRLRKIIFCK